MSEQQDGGPAFGTNGLGMTLRDWFAGQALAGMMAADEVVPVGTSDPRGFLAQAAYAMADAMLKARKP